MLAATGSINFLLVPGAALFLPLVLTLCFRLAVLQTSEAKKETLWASYRGFTRVILIVTVTGWWVIWRLHGRPALISLIEHRWVGTIGTFSSEALLFGVPPIISLGVFLFLCYTTDKTILKLKWTVTDTLRQSWWRLVSLVIPLLMIGAGFDAILDGKLWGVAWLLAAGVISRVGTAFLRLAEGMKFNTLKSGELRNRALILARRMEVTLGTVYVVPAGKGHLTNAYGLSDAIALTDNLGKYLTKAEIDCVITHELAHVKLKHARKTLLLVIAIFSVTSLLLFCLPQEALLFRPPIQFFAIIGPILALCYCSRRFEYSADREAVDFAGDPATVIRTLANLEMIRELPTANDRFTELFMTHPTLAHRVRAIADRGNIPADRLRNILKEVGMPVSIRPKPIGVDKISR